MWYIVLFRFSSLKEIILYYLIIKIRGESEEPTTAVSFEVFHRVIYNDTRATSSGG